MERGSELGEGLRSRSGSFSAAFTYDGTDVDGGLLVQGIGVGKGVQWVGFSAEDGAKVAKVSAKEWAALEKAGSVGG